MVKPLHIQLCFCIHTDYQLTVLQINSRKIIKGWKVGEQSGSDRIKSIRRQDCQIRRLYLALFPVDIAILYFDH